MVSEESSLSGSGKIYIQFATVQTPDWKNLKKEDRMMICSTNSQGEYGEERPYNVGSFMEEFFPVSEGLWQKRVSAVFDKAAQMYELKVLNPDGLETGKKNHISAQILNDNFMPES